VRVVTVAGHEKGGRREAALASAEAMGVGVREKASRHEGEDTATPSGAVAAEGLGPVVPGGGTRGGRSTGSGSRLGGRAGPVSLTRRRATSVTQRRRAGLWWLGLARCTGRRDARRGPMGNGSRLGGSAGGRCPPRGVAPRRRHSDAAQGCGGWGFAARRRVTRRGQQRRRHGATAVRAHAVPERNLRAGGRRRIACASTDAVAHRRLAPCPPTRWRAIRRGHSDAGAGAAAAGCTRMRCPSETREGAADGWPVGAWCRVPSREVAPSSEGTVGREQGFGRRVVSDQQEKRTGRQGDCGTAWGRAFGLESAPGWSRPVSPTGEQGRGRPHCPVIRSSIAVHRVGRRRCGPGCGRLIRSWAPEPGRSPHRSVPGTSLAAPADDMTLPS
jgi:hypothetical protein